MLRGRPTATSLGHVRLGNHAAGMSSRAELRLARIGVNSEMLDRSRPAPCDSTCPSRGSKMALSRDFAGLEAARQHADTTWTELYSSPSRSRAGLGIVDRWDQPELSGVRMLAQTKVFPSGGGCVARLPLPGRRGIVAVRTPLMKGRAMPATAVPLAAEIRLPGEPEPRRPGRICPSTAGNRCRRGRRRPRTCRSR